MIEGTAEVRQGDELIRTVGPGDFVGDRLITGQPRTASVVATSPVHALVIEGHAFRRLLEDAPSIDALVRRAATERLDRDADGAKA